MMVQTLGTWVALLFDPDEDEDWWKLLLPKVVLIIIGTLMIALFLRYSPSLAGALGTLSARAFVDGSILDYMFLVACCIGSAFGGLLYILFTIVVWSSLFN